MRSPKRACRIYPCRPRPPSYGKRLPGPLSGGHIHSRNFQGGQMNDVRYEAPKTLEAAVALLSGANGRGKVLAGGTDLLIQMRAGRVEPGLLVDIKGIPEMTSIVAENGGFRFGAAGTCMELVEHEAFAKAWPG